MRKIIAGLMATAMVTSISATASFAATAAQATAPALAANVSANQSVTMLALTVNGTNKAYLSIGDYDVGGFTSGEVAMFLDSLPLKNIKFSNNRNYNITLKAESNNGVTAIVSTTGKIPDNTTLEIALLDANGEELNLDNNAGKLTYTFNFGASGSSTGTGDMTADIEASGDLDKLDIGDVIECDGQGNPIPLTEKRTGVDQDRNDDGGVQSNKTVYFMIKQGEYNFDNESFWKLKISKGDNGKMIKSISDVSKNFDDTLINATNNVNILDTDGRHRFIKVELNENITDDEYKIGLDLRLSAKSAAARVFGIKEESEIKVKDFTFYMKNITRNADNDWKVGINGLMLDPIKNDWNNVTYFDEDGDVAFLKFFGDSDVEKFYSKLSTKWIHADYAAYFNDQDAYYFEFTGSPQLSATSRADLQIYNPFKDDNGNETIDPKTATIYQVIDGDLVDVTASFTYGEGENGENAFITRTRFLGNYIICEKPITKKG